MLAVFLIGQKIGTVEQRGVVAAQEIAGKYAVMWENIRNKLEARGRYLEQRQVVPAGASP